MEKIYIYIKKFWYIPIILIVILIILFFWKESISSKFPINSSKISDFFNIIGSILSVITVLLLFVQINEMIKDRKAANQPDLYPNDVNFQTDDEGYPSDDNSKYYEVPFFWKTREDGSKEMRVPYITLYNIGLGAAKEIHVKWNFDLEAIKKFNNDTYALPEYKGNERKIDFIPAGQSRDIDIPFQYMIVCGKQLNTDIISLIQPEDLHKNLKPKLELLVNFMDIYSNLHDRKFELNFECHEIFISIKIAFIK